MMNPAHRDASASTGQDAAYERLVARHSSPDALVAALEKVIAEARRRAAAQEEAARGRSMVSVVEHDAAAAVAAQLAHRSSRQVSSNGSRRVGEAASAGPHTLPRVTTAGEDGAAVIGAVARPYVKTGRRVSSGYQLAIEALVLTTADARQVGGLLPEHQRICHLCRDFKSVAEVAALLHMTLGVARIVVADLAEAGLVAIHQPGGNDARGGVPDARLIEQVLDGLRKL